MHQSTLAHIPGRRKYGRVRTEKNPCLLHSCKKDKEEWGKSLAYVFLRIWAFGQPGLWWSLLMLAVSLPLAYLFMLGIERRRFPLWAIVGLWVITLLLCRTGRRTSGVLATYTSINYARDCGSKVAYAFCARVQQHEKDLRMFLQELRGAGKKAVLIAPTPEFPPQPPLLHFDKVFTLRGISPGDAEKTAVVCNMEFYLRTNKTVLSILHKMRDEGLCTVIEPMKILHPGEVIRAARNSKLLTSDDNHMKPDLSIPLVQRLRAELRKAPK